MSDANTRKREKTRIFGPLRLVCVTAAVLTTVMLCRSGAYWVDSLHRWAVGQGILSAGETPLETLLPDELLDEDSSAAGTVLLQEDGTYRTVLTVQDSDGETVYRWFSATCWLTACAMGDGEVAAAGVTDDGAWQLLRLDPMTTEPLETVTLDGVNVVYDLAYLDGTLCAVTDAAVLLFRDGQVTQLPCGEVLDYAFGSSFVAVLEPVAVRLCTMDGRSSLIAAELAERITANGRYWAVMTPETVTVYTANGRCISTVDRDGSPVTLRDDGSLFT